MCIVPKKQKLTPILKYPGGKDKELVHIIPNIPLSAKNYYEPFVGGGAVYFSLNADKYYINDKSTELMQLFGLIKECNKEFLYNLEQIDHNWKIISEIVFNHTNEIMNIYNAYKFKKIDKQKLFDSISSFVLHNADEFNGLLSTDFNIGIQNFVNELIKSFKNKILRMVEIEQQRKELQHDDFMQNIECAFKSAFYMHFRYLYNNANELNISMPFFIAIYFYIREFCYSSMFRYNANGGFNVPYGGISYNKKTLTKKIEYFSNDKLLSHLNKTTMDCLDFEEFLEKYAPTKQDFMFLDPPYDTEFSTYAKNTFDKHDQERLANYLKTKCPCYFMLIIKKSDLILQLYKNGEITQNGRIIHTTSFDKKYFVSFQNRNNKNAEHLMITNYSINEVL